MPLFKSFAVYITSIGWLSVLSDIFNSQACPRQTHTIAQGAAEIVSSRTHITDYAYTTSYVHSGVCLRMPFSFRC